MSEDIFLAKEQPNGVETEGMELCYMFTKSR